MTSTFFQVLGVPPLHGRLFDEADARPDAAATAVVSHAFWMRELGGSSAAIGQTISVNRRPVTVIGVLAPGFRYMTPADVYVLLEPQIAANYRGMQSRNTRTSLFAVARLKPGVSVDGGADGDADDRGRARPGTLAARAGCCSSRSPTASSRTWRPR